MSNKKDGMKPDIRIGTLVGAGMKSARYIEQILPHGFESFSLTFWQTTRGIDWKKLSDGVNRALDGTGAVISSLGIFGNPLETEAKDKETKEKNYACVHDFTGRFRSRHSSLLCRELLGCDLTTPEAREMAKQKGLFTERCPRFVRDAAEILEDVL